MSKKKNKKKQQTVAEDVLALHDEENGEAETIDASSSRDNDSTPDINELLKKYLVGESASEKNIDDARVEAEPESLITDDQIDLSGLDSRLLLSDDLPVKGKLDVNEIVTDEDITVDGKLDSSLLVSDEFTGDEGPVEEVFFGEDHVAPELNIDEEPEEPKESLLDDAINMAFLSDDSDDITDNVEAASGDDELEPEVLFGVSDNVDEEPAADEEEPEEESEETEVYPDDEEDDVLSGLTLSSLMNYTPDEETADVTEEEEPEVQPEASEAEDDEDSEYEDAFAALMSVPDTEKSEVTEDLLYPSEEIQEEQNIVESSAEETDNVTDEEPEDGTAYQEDQDYIAEMLFDSDETGDTADEETAAVEEVQSDELTEEDTDELIKAFEAEKTGLFSMFRKRREKTAEAEPVSEDTEEIPEQEEETADDTQENVVEDIQPEDITEDETELIIAPPELEIPEFGDFEAVESADSSVEEVPAAEETDAYDEPETEFYPEEEIITGEIEDNDETEDAGEIEETDEIENAGEFTDTEEQVEAEEEKPEITGMGALFEEAPAVNADELDIEPEPDTSTATSDEDELLRRAMYYIEKEERKAAEERAAEEARIRAEAEAAEAKLREEEAARAAEAEKAKEEAAAQKVAEITGRSVEEVEAEMEGDSEEDLTVTEYDSTDLNLMVAFGMDVDSDVKADSNKTAKIKEYGDKLQADNSGKRKTKLDRDEFVDRTQIPDIRNEYKKRKRGLVFRLIICAAFTLGLFVFENIEPLSKLLTGAELQHGGIFDPCVYPTIYVMTSLQLMLLACMCAFDRIVYGFKRLFTGNPCPETITALLTVAGIVCSSVISKTTVVPVKPVIYNFVVAFAAFMTLAAALLDTKREYANFRVISSKRPKHIVRRLSDDESLGETKAFVDYDDICDVMKVDKADFIEGFFGRLSKPDHTKSVFITAVMSVTAAVAVLFGVFAGMRGFDTAAVWRVVYAVIVMMLPASLFVAFSYPLYKINAEISGDDFGSAIIGETSLEEYSNASIISFDDKSVFPAISVKVQNIKVYNNARFDRVLYYAASVFGTAGGPLKDVFETATRDMGVSSNVKIILAGAGVLETTVDGVNIVFGTCDVLRQNGYEIPKSVSDEEIDLSDELQTMYMIRERKLFAKFYIQYIMDPDIEVILRQFSNSSLYVCVRTFDPNISEDMIAKKVKMKHMPLRTVRYNNTDEIGVYEEKADSGLVTCGTPKSLLQVITYCSKVLHTRKTEMALCILASVIGAIILFLCVASGLMDSFRSAFVGIHQLAWLIAVYISARLFLR